MHRPAVVLLLILVASTAVGSVLRGHVTDPSNHILPGATIEVRPIGASTTTNREGNFVIADIKPGTYTVEISYVGFLSESREVNLSAAPVTIDVQLNLSPTVSETVAVTASRERGQVEALNERKSAPNIVDILPQETIASLPNANVAEALARLPSVSVERDEGEPKYVQVRGLEPRFTSVTVNGIRIPTDQADVRQIKLDAFPSDMVQSLELNKTVSADQEGDAIGGAINLSRHRGKSSRRPRALPSSRTLFP